MRVLNYSITETEAVRAISETNQQISTWWDKYTSGTAMECTVPLTVWTAAIPTNLRLTKNIQVLKWKSKAHKIP